MPSLTPEAVRRVDRARPTTAQLRETAQALAADGYAVFPLAVGGKRPIEQGGYRTATRDPQKIDAWWADKPYNVGISAGGCGMLVVDLDIKKSNGLQSWAEATRGLDLPEPIIINTPSGGEHWYYRAEGEAQALKNAAGVLPGVDIRSEGGHVVAPGSYTVADGDVAEGYYAPAGENDLPPVEDLPAASRDLVRVLSAGRTRERSEATGSTSEALPLYPEGQVTALFREYDRLANTTEGRNNQLNASAMALAQIVAGQDPAFDEQQARTALEEACRRNGLIEDDGYSAFLATLNSGWAKGSGEPRTLAPNPKVTAGGFEGRLLDVSAWLSEDHPLPERFGMGEILYKEGLHWVAGEPESGKSVLAYQWALDVATSGGRALILDEEAGERDALGKLAALEPATDRWAKGIDYLPPTGWNLMVNAAAFRQFVLDRRVSMVVVDSAATALAGAGIEENDNGPVLQFINAVLIPLAKDHGLCVVVIDHKTKTNSDSRWARGAGSKLGAVDFQISVSASVPFSRDRNGVVRIVCDKDRFGVHGRGHEWRVDVAVGDGKILPSATDMGFGGQGVGPVEGDAPGELVMLAQAVAAQAGEPLNKSEIRKLIRDHKKSTGGSGLANSAASQAIREAINLGLLVAAEGNRWVAAPNDDGPPVLDGPGRSRTVRGQIPPSSGSGRAVNG